MEIIKKIGSLRLTRYVLIILFVTVSFLFAPKPHSPSEYYGTFFDLGKYAGFVINCDSYEYVRVSTNLSLLLEQNSLRQSRPLFLVLGTISGSLVYPVLKLFHFNIYQSYFAGYILLNFLFLLWSAYLFDGLLVKHTSLGVVERSAFLILLISNNVTKAYFWTAHEQMFTFLTPMLCIYMLDFIKGGNKLFSSTILFFSFLCGLSLLVYGNFALLAVSITAALIYYRAKFRTIAISASLIMFPTFCWILILRLKGVAYYNHEVAEYHQFIWIFNSLQKSLTDLSMVARHNFDTFLNSFNLPILVSAIMALLLMGLSFFRRLSEKANQIAFYCLFIIGIGFTFFYCLGFYQQRLTYTLMVPLLLLIALFSNWLFVRMKVVSISILIVFVILWHLYNLTLYGPFS